MKRFFSNYRDYKFVVCYIKANGMNGSNTCIVSSTSIEMAEVMVFNEYSNSELADAPLRLLSITKHWTTTLTDDSQIVLELDGSDTLTLDELIRQNSDPAEAINEDDLAAIRALTVGDRYTLEMGAGGQTFIERIAGQVY